jgi:exosortase/archaeosortase family protein
LAAPNFVSLLSASLNDNFGTVLPAIPFAALLIVILAFRWSEMRERLRSEGGLTSDPITRLFGVAIVVNLLALRSIVDSSVELAGMTVVLVYYATALAVNPKTKGFLLPYAALFAAGVTLPTILQRAAGEPLANLSSSLSAGLVTLLGIPVTWNGTQLAFLTATGTAIRTTITPGCSSLISLTTFLGLLGLFHLDLKKDLLSTIKLGAAGVLALVALNSARIAILIWVGYVEGEAAFWDVHNWVGYAIFLGFYLAVLPIYSRMGVRKSSGAVGGTSTPG